MLLYANRATQPGVQFKVHGQLAVTDLQVWSRRLSVQETRSWALCRGQQEGDLVSWQEAPILYKYSY